MQTTQNQVVESAQTSQDIANMLLLAYANGEQEKINLKEKLKQVEERQAARRDELLAWADKHATEFDGKKTLALAGGTIGYKKEGERLVWDLELTPEDHEVKLLKLVANDYPDALAPKVDMKQLLKAWCVLPNLRKKLQKLGLMSRNDENFYIALKK